MSVFAKYSRYKYLIFKKALNKLRSLFIKSVNENKIIFEVLSNKYEKGIMIDVGACYGSTLLPFLKADYIIYAFEPEKKIENLNKYINYPNLTIDSRGVSMLLTTM